MFRMPPAPNAYEKVPESPSWLSAVVRRVWVKLLGIGLRPCLAVMLRKLSRALINLWANVLYTVRKCQQQGATGRVLFEPTLAVSSAEGIGPGFKFICLIPYN